LLAGASDDAAVLKLKANILRHLGRYAACVEIYGALLERDPAQPKVWTSLGHSLRALGERAQCVSAYRRAVALEPQLGEAYWSLANLGMRQIGDADLLAMQNQLKNPLLSQDDRIHMHFAIGKGLEARGEFEASFRHYADGNRLRRQGVSYDASEFTSLVQRLKEQFSVAFFAERKDCGADAVDPIFVVGLPRAGSTLVEQILASHSAIEGTAELPDLALLVKSVDQRMAAAGHGRYPAAVAALGSSELRELGQRYIEQTRVQRKEGKPSFVDKMPNNFIHAGFIHLILPHARIVDVRRHPMACGLSLFKLLFVYGQQFSYSLGDIGRYYRDYVDLMAHYESVLPGRLHRIHYESLVTDTETEVRRLLNYCGLPFQPSCLNFHENRRPVATPASEQVRLPVYRNAAQQWRHYEPWLDPLKSALGPLVDDYPMPPALR
jgi:tetratricopeptide (TPR) repeat protein